MGLAERSQIEYLQASVSPNVCGNLAFFPGVESKVSKVLAESANQQQTDEELMEAYRDDDIQAFDRLFNRYKDVLYRYLVRQSGNPSQAEEMFQEVWAGLIKQRKRYIVKAKFKTYLFHIAHNKLIDYYRSNSRADILSYDDEDQTINESFEHKDQPERQADVTSQLEILNVQLNKLPAAQRDVFLLHAEAGMTLAEIAESMGVSRDTIKSRLRYALQRLRRAMERYS